MAWNGAGELSWSGLGELAEGSQAERFSKDGADPEQGWTQRQELKWGNAAGKGITDISKSLAREEFQQRGLNKTDYRAESTIWLCAGVEASNLSRED